jgi:hypothetical protein
MLRNGHKWIRFETGIVQHADAFKFTVSPNPSNGIISVSTALQIYEVKIFDIMGNTCYSNMNLHKESFFVDLHNQSAGIYFIRLRSGDLVSTQKLLLEK